MTIRIALVFGLMLASSVCAQAQTKRALLIGINRYSPSVDERIELKKIDAEPHKADSRFAPGYEWPDLRGPLNDVESMHLLLRDTYEFQEKNIRILTDRQATRDGILKAFDDLIAATQSGDTVVFFFAGHGSQRLNTMVGVNTSMLSKEENRDQTIVPADAYKGVFDIRDKELAQRFNRILDDKKARMIAIFDSCHSGTMARGLPINGVARTLEYDDRDVAKDPTAYKGADLKHAPKDGNAIIVTASLATESAQEVYFPDDQLWRGVFTRSFVGALKNANANWSAVDLIHSVQYAMKVDNLPAQQPTVEGRVNESLFGDPVPTRLHASVISAAAGQVHLDIGSIAAIDVGTRFTSVGPGDRTTTKGDQSNMLEIISVDGPTHSTSKVVSGDAKISPGMLFEITEMRTRADVRLRIFIASDDWDSAKAPPQQAKAKFAGFDWVDDPSLQPVQYYVTRLQDQWKAFDSTDAEISPAVVNALAAQNKPRKAFLALPPTAEMVRSLQGLPGFKSRVFEFVPSIIGSHYMLVGRENSSGMQYSLLRSDFMGPRPAIGYIQSLATQNPESTVVCGQDRSLPIRSEWVPVDRAPTAAASLSAADMLQGVAARFAKLRGWMLLQTDLQPSGFWPYHLTVEVQIDGKEQEVTSSTVLAANTSYDIFLQANQDDLATHQVQPLYGYMVGFDCSGRSYLLYPRVDSNGGAKQPALKADGTYPTRVPLASETVGPPFGADSLFLLVTPEKITDLNVFSFDGVINRSGSSRGIGERLAAMVRGLGDYGTRGFSTSSDQWTVQSIIIPSRPPEK
jgi:hypothetical protein